MHEDAAARAIGVILDYDRIYPIVVVNLPSNFHLLKIKDDQEMSARRAGGRILAVSRHGDVVQTSFHRDALYLFERLRVDNIQRAGILHLRAGIADAD